MTRKTTLTDPNTTMKSNLKNLNKASISKHRNKLRKIKMNYSKNKNNMTEKEYILNGYRSKDRNNGRKPITKL